MTPDELAARMHKAMLAKWRAENMLKSIDSRLKTMRRRRREWNKKLGNALRKMAAMQMRGQHDQS